jgi:hypothetical protein
MLDAFCRSEFSLQMTKEGLMSTRLQKTLMIATALMILFSLPSCGSADSLGQEATQTSAESRGTATSSPQRTRVPVEPTQATPDWGDQVTWVGNDPFAVSGLEMDTTGDVDTEAVVVGSTNEEARRTGNGQALPSDDGNDIGDHYLQFRVDDAFLFEGSPTSHVRIEVEYYDSGTDQFSLQYDAFTDGPFGDGRFKDADSFQKAGSGEFRTAVFDLRDAYFANRDNGGDFRISDNGDGAETITRVSVQRIFSSSDSSGFEDVQVWVMDNADREYETPPYGDTITIIDGSGHVLNTLDGFNLQVFFGQQIAVLPDGQSALISLLTDSQTEYTDLSGSVLISLDASGAENWSINMIALGVHLSSNGDAYVLDGHSRIVRLDPADGSIVKEVNVVGEELVVDDEHDAIWTVGTEIRRLSLDLDLEFVIDLPDVRAWSVDYLSDGSVWVGEVLAEGNYGRANRLWRISPSGETMGFIDLEDKPHCIAVDRRDDSVWVATSEAILKFDHNGDLVLRMEDGGYSVRVNTHDSTTWVAHQSGRVVLYSADGAELASADLSPGRFLRIGIP